MGGVAMLLIIAASGITYGWVPDGGSGVRYIIQVPPDQLDQMKRVGEVSSRIPAEISGHVTEVVIQVGTGSVPRVTPPELARAGGAVNAPTGAMAASGSLAADHADRNPLPIPSISDASELVPLRPTAATSLMKPAPQSGGMNLPGGFAPPTAPPSTVPPPNPQTVNPIQMAQDAFNSLRNGAVPSTDPRSVSADPRGVSAGNSAAPSTQPTGSNGYGAAPTYNGASTYAAPPIYGPPTNPAGNNSSANNSMTNPASTTSRGNEPAYGNDPRYSKESPYSSTAATQQPRPEDDPRYRITRAEANAPAERAAEGYPPNNPNAAPAFTNGQIASNPATAQSQEWYDLRNAPARRPSTDPSASPATEFATGSTPGGYAGTNFGRVPGSSSNPSSTNYSTNGNSQSPSTGYSTAGSTNRLDYDPNLTAAQASQLPPGGYSFDRFGYAIDREGYRLDRYGQRTEGVSGNLASSTNPAGSFPAGNPYSNPNGSLIGVPPLTSGGYADPNQSRASTVGQYGQVGAFGPSTTYGNAANPPISTYPPYDPRLTPPNLRPATGDSGLASPSDRVFADDRLGSDRIGSDRAGSDLVNGRGLTDRDFGPTDENMAAQPVFNGMLLLSIVANIYLVFWLKNLRLQFKDLVTAKRAATGGGVVAGA